jgi:hypothetical protein
MTRWLIAVAALLVLSACTATVRPQQTKIETPDVTVTVGGGGGTFCPPGQAKKGRC